MLGQALRFLAQHSVFLSPLDLRDPEGSDWPQPLILALEAASLLPQEALVTCLSNHLVRADFCCSLRQAQFVQSRQHMHTQAQWSYLYAHTDTDTCTWLRWNSPVQLPVHAQAFPLFFYSHRCTQVTHICIHVHVYCSCVNIHVCAHYYFTEIRVSTVHTHTHPQALIPLPWVTGVDKAEGPSSLNTRVLAPPLHGPLSSPANAVLALSKGSYFASSMGWA